MFSQEQWGQLLANFIEEAKELIQQAEAALLALDDGHEDPELVNALFRSVHTLKGSAGLFALDDFVAFTHHQESLIMRVRDQMIPLSREQISALLGEYAMPDKVYSFMTDKIAEDEQAENADNVSVAVNLKDRIANLNGKQKILLDSYLDQDIDRQTFLAKKSEILSEKKSLEENLAHLQTSQFAWIEPMRNWLGTAKSICYLHETDDLIGQKAILAEIFGSNLALQNKTLTPPTNKKDGWAGSKTAFRKGAESSFCLWQALKSTNEKIAPESDNSDIFLKMAGVEGLEPPNAWTKTMCLTTWRHPNGSRTTPQHSLV